MTPMLDLMTILAANGVVDIDSIIAVAQLTFTAGLAVFTGVIAAKAKRIDTLEARLLQATEKAIEERFAGIDKTVAESLESEKRVAELRLHALERGQEQTAQRCALLESKDHELLLNVHKEIAKLKDVVATREDLKQLREEVKRNA